MLRRSLIAISPASIWRTPRCVRPVSGIVTNFSRRPGPYAAAGQPVMTRADSDSYDVAGYFEETKLSHIRSGVRVTIRVMARIGRFLAKLKADRRALTIANGRTRPERYLRMSIPP
jgi:multidrug resistance efflux pump